MPNFESITLDSRSQILKDTKLSSDFSVDRLAAATEGCSGSDLKELCRNAAMVPVREYMRCSSGDQDALQRGQLEVCIQVIPSSDPTDPFLGISLASFVIDGFLCKR